jgi:two-component system nitrogen regulation sensor histidine kinase NtrY
MASVLLGLNFANRLVAPIRRLMNAANLVSTGDLKVQVPVMKSEGDLAQLGETFNKMTQELRTQRDELVSASELIDSRRRFIEAVLSSASAGIIGVDGSGSIGILNRSAEKLIGHAESETLGHPLSDVLPELDEMMKNAREGNQRLVQGQVTILRDGNERNLSVRVSAEKTSEATRDSYIITLDDITELVSAQRTSAWGDVARRIAHEIKNPLTPIQLSAERIRRKFGKVITEDKAVFDQCTDTIVRQVDDIRRMVDEFSRFARMPKPVIEGEDVADTVRQAVFLMRVAHPEIDMEADIKEDPLRAQFDRRLISQALTNIIKNATEAIEAVPAEELGKDQGKGRIDVIAQRENDQIVIDVIDNGIGLPKVARQRLLEPYVTTRAKGTGLGLAIVGRVLEDHGGRIELKDAADFRPGQRGAWMRLRFAVSGHAPKVEVQSAAAQKADSKEQGAGSNPAVSETKGTGEARQPPAGQTPDTAQTTNSDTTTHSTTDQDTKTEAATGN